MEEDEEFKLDLGDLDLTTDEINFDKIDEDLGRFQQDEIVKEALEKGVDLRHYSRQIEKDLKSIEQLSIGDYVREADHIALLFQQVSACEEVLGGMQEMLQGFRSNLGDISQEIKSLQNESLTMNIKLNNRRAVHARLTTFLDKVAVSEDMINILCTGEVDDRFLDTVVSLSEKLKFTSAGGASGGGFGSTSRLGSPTHAGAGAGAGVGGGAPFSSPGGTEVIRLEDLGVAPSDTAAGKDALPELERLRVRTVARCREYLLIKISELKQAKTNLQKTQEYVLLKAKPLMQFLQDHAPPVASEVRQSYVETMGKIVQNIVKTYYTSLSKLELPCATKSDVIVVEHGVVRSMFSASRADLSSKVDVFDVGTRDSVLRDFDAAPLHIHVAQAEKQRLPFEALFRSLQKLLIEAAIAEFHFTSRFFSDPHGDIFMRVFAKSISQVLESLEGYLCQCFDAIAIMLLIHITHLQRRAMNLRRMACLDAYFDRVNMMLWPRFKQVLELNLQSIRSANLKKMGSVDLGAHYISRRYAEFTASIANLHRTLQAEDMSDDSVLHNLAMLRSELVRLLQKLSESHSTKKDRTAFLINNVNAIIGVLRERHVSAEDVAVYEDLLARQTAVFVEEELGSHFQPLISFVRTTEADVHAIALSSGRGGGAGAGAGAPVTSGGGGRGTESKLPEGIVPRVDHAVADTLARDFSRTWKQAMAAINSSVSRYFANPRDAMEILKQVLTQLLMYYTRFQEIIKRCFADSPLERSLVRVQEIFAEIKVYSRTVE